MANFFDDLVDMFSGNKKKEQGAEQAPSLLVPITDAWTGFLNRVNESNKQNIQSGHYTVAEPQQQQTSPAMDYSMQPQEMSWDDLTRATVDKLTEMITGKKKQPWETDSPFGDKDVDERFAQTVIELDAADPGMKNKNILKDAYDITSRYVNDVFASDGVVPLTSKVNPFDVADREWRKALDAKIGEVSAAGKSAEELRAMLDEGHYETEKQHREKQNQGIIAAAQEMRNKENPYYQIMQLTAGEPTAENMQAVGQALNALGDEGRQMMEYMQRMNMTDAQAMDFIRGQAEQRYQPAQMTFDEADRLMNEQYPMYGLAKDTQGSMDEYSAAYGDVRAIGLKAARGEELTDTERQVWSEAVQEMPWLSDWKMNLDSTGKSMDVRFGLNMQQQAELEAYGKTKAQQIADVAGMYTPYAVSPKNQAIWEAYTRTPEGAAQWAEDAQGTKDAQKAKDNLLFVERKSKYDEVASRPDFAETSKANEDFHSGDEGFDQIYNVINNIGGAAEQAGLLADIGGSRNYAVTLNHFMKPVEKGIFNTYAKSGAIDAAKEYLDHLSYDINERMTKEGTERMRAMSESGVGGALVGSAVSVPLSLARGVGYLDQLGQNVAQIFTGRPVDRNSQANMIGKLADSAREGVQNQVDWNVNILGQDVDVFDFLYGTAMSGIDSFTAGQLGAALGGIANSAKKAQKLASWTGAAILGGGAAQSAMQEAYDRGANDGTALLMGALAGANETIWEHWSIGNLIKHGQDVGKKTFAEEIKNAFIEAGVNASEEFNTSVANGIAEYFLNHDDRDVQKKADEYERLGLSPEAALEKARGEFWASAVMDAAGGALMGGVFGSVENVQNRQNVNRVDKAVGNGFSSESMDTLYSLAESENASKKAKELARKFPKEKANAKQMGELFRELSNTMGAGIREALHNMGVADIALQIGQETGTVDRAAADAVTAMMQGENMSGEQVAALAANPAAMKIVDELFKPEAGDGVTSSAADAAPSPQGEDLEPVQFEPMPGMEEAEAKRRQAGQATQIQPLPQGQTAGQRAPKTPTKPPIRMKGKEGQYTIEELKQDGTEVRIKTSGGEEISLEDADVDAGEAAVIQVAAGVENQDEAAAMIAAWQNGPRLRHQDAGPTQNRGTSTETQAEAEAEPAGQGAVMSPDKETARADEARQAQDFAMGFRAVYEAAQAGKTAEGTQSIYADMLAPEARQAAEEAGRQAYEQAEAQAEERNAQEAQAAGYRTVKNAGADAVGVLFDRVRDGIKKGGERVNAMLQMLDRVGREIGMQYRVVDKLENDANGKYVHGTNIVYLSLDAEEGAITKAASHEGFHFISQFSPDMKKTITDFVMDKLRQVAGYDIDQRIREVMQQYRDQAGQELTPEAATEEIVADSMLDVIGTRENMEQLMKQSKSTAEKIKEWITNTYQKFKDILNRLARNSPEVAALKDDVDYLGKISEMWNEGMRQAAEAWRQAQVGYNDGSAALEQNQAVQQYRQEMQGDMTVDDRENSLTAFLSQLFMDTQGQWIQQHMDEYEEGLAKYRQALLEYKRGGVALNVALERQGLAPLTGNDIRVASYAADQALTLEGAKERAKARAEENAETNTGGGERYSLPSQRRQEEDAAEWVRDDAELYAQLKQDPDARAALWMIERIYRNTTTGEGRTVLSEADLKKRMPEVVKRLKEQTGTTVSVKEMSNQIMTLWEALQKPGYQMGEMMHYARDMIKRWIESAPGVMAEQDETTKEILQELKHPFSLTPDMKSEIKGTFGDARDFYRKNFGKLKINNKALSTLADVWEETLTKLNPGVFAADATEADMPIILDAWLETAGRREVSGDFGANIGAMSTDLAMNTILELFNTPDILQTRYEMNKARVDRTYQLYQAAERLVATVREGYKQKYQERIERDRQTEAKRGVINEIRKNVRPLKTMLVKGTDNRHIPEAMRGAMERMLNNLGMDRAIFSGQEAWELYMKLKKWAADSQLHDAAEAAAYDPDILAKLEWLEEHAGKSKALRDMTMQELEAVRDAVQNMYKMVMGENEIEVAGRKLKVSALAENVMAEMKDKKEASSHPVLAFLRKVGFKEMTPVYYAKQVGGTLGDLINDIIRSESDVAFIIKDAKGAFDKAAEKYHLNEWIHDKNHLNFITDAGDTIELTREQAMTLYAWAEREKRNKTQSAAHLRRGGFTYDRNDKEVKQMKGVNFTKSHVLSVGDLAQIRNYLTEEQRGFVEEMVKYLSENMAEKGNEASMRMFGWKKFGEKWYFPYPTDRNFRGKNSTDAKGQPDKQIKYMGSSHALTEKAMNPLKLGNFTDIWAGHVDEMARYSVMAEKLDNLQRVTNYVVAGSEKVDNETGVEDVIAPESVKKEIERALGQEGAHYLEQFIRDANGGVMGDERGLSDKFISLFKKGSVAANMSVILQQPSAFVRAMSMVNPRYFGRGLHEHGGYKATRERMYANSGVANLKQWGGFDTNTGGSFANTLLDSIGPDGAKETFYNFMDKWTGKGAEKADEITWVYMYSAIEAEIDDRTDYKRGTEDFNQAVAKRFDEVMRATQVYDSSMAKSEWMRSTSTMDKVVTSFMAEPTLWINMMMDAALDLKNNAPGARGKAARAVGVFVAGTFVNSLLQSIATAFRRKKDEGTTMAEKYLAELAGNFTDSLSIEGIAGMIPIARDIVSLAQGYDVERADMAVIGNMIDAWRKMEQHMKKGEMPEVDEWMNLAGMAANMFGIPLRNVWRDASGIWKNVMPDTVFYGGGSSPIGETSWRDILYSVLDETSWNSFVKLWDPSNAAYYDRMEQALIKGDMDKYNELRGYLEDTKRVKGDTISTGIKNELKESVLRGLVTEEKAVELMVDLLGVKDEKTAFDQIDKYVAKAKANGDEDFEYSKYAGLMDAVKSGGDVEAEIKRLEDRGNARKTVVSTIKSQVKDWYLAGDMTKAQAEKALKTYVGISDSDNNALYWTLDEWEWLKANPNGSYKSYGNIFDAVDSGNAQKIKAAVQKHLDHPHTKQMATDVHRQITDHFKPIYVELVKGGKKTEAANLKAAILTAYEAAGYARDMKNKDIDKWVK